MRNKETDILKGIAILMVVESHIGQAFGADFMSPLEPIGVFLFLFISGYGDGWKNIIRVISCVCI